MIRIQLYIYLYILVATPSLAKCEHRSDASFWNSMVDADLEKALNVKWNLGLAKNVILFIGDGMGPNTVTATRLYKFGESGSLSFESFPHVGLLKTYSSDMQVTDSAAGGTALFTGFKVNSHTLGVDALVQLDDCDGSLLPVNRLKTLVSYAQEAGKSTGFVTTTRVTHATPAGLYAHCPNRRWECEAKIPNTGKNCKDIARQLVEDVPGKDINVIMGGGTQMLISNVSGSVDDPIDTWSCYSKDGRNLMKDWMADKEKRGIKYKVTSKNFELNNLDYKNTDYLLGIFANGHLKMEHERDKGPNGMPSITEMTEAALRILQKNDKGFFLMVEGGNIDMAHHRGKAKRAINEAAAMDEAVKMALTMTKEEDTLIIVTSDHTHTLSINGYPKRGSDVFGIASASKMDGRNYTTLTYATGGPGSYKYTVNVTAEGESVAVREDPNTVDTTDFDYEQLAAIKTDENTHGGGDVVVYAKGPYSHLFHNVHEQHYVFHVISYAAKLGKYTNFSVRIEVSYLLLCFSSVFYLFIKQSKLIAY